MLKRSTGIAAATIFFAAAAFGQAVPHKKNSRPNTPPPVQAETPKMGTPEYFYEFSQPRFAVTSIKIVHDAAGRGTVTFLRRDEDEEITDPIVVSAAAIERINAALNELDFINSTADYQYEKDYSHLGTINFALERNGKRRKTAFNWTEVKPAKALADEYRKLGNQYVWQFEMAAARQNQPLNAPRLMDSLDSLLRRGEISDPKQMLPLLKKLSEDERIPLIARNHAQRMSERISKDK